MFFFSRLISSTFYSIITVIYSSWKLNVKKTGTFRNQQAQRHAFKILELLTENGKQILISSFKFQVLTENNLKNSSDNYVC
jgi:hypothetical protein